MCHTRLLMCHQCRTPAAGLTFSGAQQMLRREGRKRLHAHVRCGHCSHEWWSVHPEALRLSREADARAKAAAP